MKRPAKNPKKKKANGKTEKLRVYIGYHKLDEGFSQPQFLSYDPLETEQWVREDRERNHYTMFEIDFD